MQQLGIVVHLSIRNIGKVLEASIEIAGITVIAGENNTGKSTIGEVLFAAFNSFHDPEQRIRAERVAAIEGTLLRTTDLPSIPINLGNSFRIGGEVNEIAEQLVEEFSHKEPSERLINESILAFVEKGGISDEEVLEGLKEDVSEAARRVFEILAFSNEDLFRVVLADSFKNEFSDQVNNVYAEDPAEVALTVKGVTSRIRIENNKVSFSGNFLRLRTEALYLDDPFVLDSAASSFRFIQLDSSHRGHLEDRLSKRVARESGAVVDHLIAASRLENVYQVINGVCRGDVIETQGRGLKYALPGSDKLLDVRNLSSGLKTFALIKRLLLNGSIAESGTLILDEPEIHLHPEWQLVFAELIVMLQKEFSLHILLNTHSPYFLNAIQVYAGKHGIEDVCRYYQAVSRGEGSVIEDVTECVEKIYDQLARPFQMLEDESYAV